MLDKIVADIRSLSREEWIQLVSDRMSDLRIWVQENAELAAIAGFFLGILITLAFKLVLIALAAFAVGALIIWSIAQPAKEKTKGGVIDITKESVSSSPPLSEINRDNLNGESDKGRMDQ